ncbi:ABC transporter substrate-binding protein [Microbacterium sp. ARD31]|jgi:peptide/nickel transport system substrate-binding protein|uniref:ABC transporter substrate-binding protein n=1 Tax=unclassified Microbacterium TaxID=2609290 RepID=UPI002040D35A|nr:MULTISPECIES: ABC transporter substrate-binding protein [unclassified Microbacterium]MDT0181758.1 ABC transporter substrate-binding protein [Microbacterium sp. ARD31]
MFRWKATAAALAITALALTGCAGGGTDSGNGGGSASGGTLTLGAIIEPLTLDPAGAEWGNRSPFYQAMYDTLLLATPEGEIEPFLATAWEYNEDNTVLTLTIREDVTFTDGSELTADVVVENLQRFKDGTSPDASYFAGVTSFEAPDATTVTITLDAPNPALLNYLTRDAGLIASSEAIAAGDLATNPVGSGPYVLDTGATVAGTSYVYTANEDYWNPELQHYDRLVINVLSDQTAALNAIKAGEANAVKVTSSDNLAEIEGAGWTVNANELDVASLLLLDRAGDMNEPLGDVRVRQAINHAFDREGLLQALEGGNGTVTGQMFPPSSAAYDAELDEYYGYDPEKAKELLAEAGYEDGFTLELPNSALLGGTTYTLHEQQLADIGITVEYTDPGSNFIADLLAPKFPAAYIPLEQNPDWQLIQFMLSPTAIFNPFKYEDPQVNEYIEQIQNGDEATQDEVVKELNRYLVEQAWFAPMYRVQGNFPSDANTTVEMLPTNTYPAIYDIYPAN